MPESTPACDLRGRLTDAFAQHFIDNATPISLWTNRETLPASLARVAEGVVAAWLRDDAIALTSPQSQVMGVSALYSLARTLLDGSTSEPTQHT